MFSAPRRVSNLPEAMPAAPAPLMMILMSHSLFPVRRRAFLSRIRNQVGNLSEFVAVNVFGARHCLPQTMKTIELERRFKR